MGTDMDEAVPVDDYSEDPHGRPHKRAGASWIARGLPMVR